MTTFPFQSLGYCQFCRNDLQLIQSHPEAVYSYCKCAAYQDFAHHLLEQRNIGEIFCSRCHARMETTPRTLIYLCPEHGASDYVIAHPKPVPAALINTAHENKLPIKCQHCDRSLPVPTQPKTPDDSETSVNFRVSGLEARQNAIIEQLVQIEARLFEAGILKPEAAGNSEDEESDP